MRLFAKLFLCATLVISLALLLSGFLLITYSHRTAIERETERALNQYQFDKFTVQADLLASTPDVQDAIPLDLLRDMTADMSGPAAFYAEDKTLLYSALPPQPAQHQQGQEPVQPVQPQQLNLALLDEVLDDSLASQVQTLNGKEYLLVGGKITQSGTTLYLVIAIDISTVVAQKQQMEQSFFYVYFLTLGVSMLVVLTLSVLLTRPINAMSRAAASIAKGRYNKRLPVSGSDEIGELSQSFNLMADAVEDRIYKLSEAALQKEDFVAGFAHELKTPLTSVIGYADMLYQKPLSPEQVKDSAWYILNEGLRLEALSQKLMDLIILNRQDFVLEEVPAFELLQTSIDGLMPLFAERQVTPHLKANTALIKVEYDLFKTLLLNLIDNAIKAGCSEIRITGTRIGDRYVVGVTDNGRGIPALELNRITEPFYMVDKSRSRRQHGAGLGLALAARIAEIHGTSLHFRSAEGSGTSVEINLACAGDELNE